MATTTRPKGRPPHLSVRFYRGGKVKCYLNYNRRRIYGGTTPFDVPAELFSLLRPDGRPRAAHCDPDLADISGRLEAFRSEVEAAMQLNLNDCGCIRRSDFRLATLMATTRTLLKARQELSMIKEILKARREAARCSTPETQQR